MGQYASLFFRECVSGYICSNFAMFLTRKEKKLENLFVILKLVNVKEVTKWN